MKPRSHLRTSVSLFLAIFLLIGPTTIAYAEEESSEKDSAEVDSGKYDDDFWAGMVFTGFSMVGGLLASSVVATPAGLLLGGVEIISAVLCEEFGCEEGIAPPPPDSTKPSRQGRKFKEIFLADEVDLMQLEALETENLSPELKEGFAILEDLIQDKRALTVTVERYQRAREKPRKTCTYGGVKIPCHEMQLLHGRWLVDRLDSNLRALAVPLQSLARSEAVQRVSVTRDGIANYLANFHAEGPPPFEEDLLQAIDATKHERELLARAHDLEVGAETWEVPASEFLVDSATRLQEGRLLRFGTSLPAEFLSSRGNAKGPDWHIGTFENETTVQRRVVAKNISCPGKHTFEVDVDATPWMEVEIGRTLEDIPVGGSKEARLEVDVASLPPGEHYGLMMIGCTTCPPPPECTQSGRRLLVRVIKKGTVVKEDSSTPTNAALDEPPSPQRPYPELRFVSAAEYRQTVKNFKDAFAEAEKARVSLEAIRPPIETPPDPIDCWFHPWHPGCDILWNPPIEAMPIWRDAVTETLPSLCDSGSGTPQAIPVVAGAAVAWLVGKALDYTWDVGVCLVKADGPDGRGLEGPDGMKKFGRCFVEPEEK
ncbi:MAG: hypothetical protein AAGD38_17095 [Acidobacteriota bacterium]